MAVGLGALGPLGAARPRAAQAGAAALCAAGATVALGFLLAGAAAQRAAIPLGLPGVGMTLALDGLSGFFLLLVLLVGTAACMAEARGAAVLAPLFATIVLTLLAGDGFALVLGFDATAVAAFALLHPHRAALRLRGVAVIAAVSLMAAVALLAVAQPPGLELSFAAIRAHPPMGWRAAAVLLLALLGVAGTAGMVPLHVGMPSACAAAPAPGPAAIAGAMAPLALYVLIRLAFDLAGPVPPPWWGVPLIVLGAIGAVLGGLRANLERDLGGVLGAATIGQIGLTVLGLGVALVARAADLPGLATFALGGALLFVVAQALAGALLGLAAGAVAERAGSQRLDRLGGLIRFMPRTTLGVLAGAATLAALPPSAGFAGIWMLLQAVLAAPHIGGLSLQMLVAGAATLMALAVALGAAAAVRLVGVGFLGRPRGPRAAGAQDPAPPAQRAMLALAGIGVLIGLFPGAVLALARPALRLAIGGDLADRSSALAIAAQPEAPGYAALAVALLLALALALVWLLLRKWVAPGHRTAPAWDGGGEPPSVRLPFGDPLTQIGGAGFAQPLQRALGPYLLRASGRRDPATVLLVRPALRLHRALAKAAARGSAVPIRQALTVVFATLVLLLLAAALLERV